MLGTPDLSRLAKAGCASLLDYEIRAVAHARIRRDAGERIRAAAFERDGNLGHRTRLAFQTTGGLDHLPHSSYTVVNCAAGAPALLQGKPTARRHPWLRRLVAEVVSDLVHLAAQPDHDCGGDVGVVGQAV